MASTGSENRERIEGALREVQDPYFGKDIISLGYLRDVEGELEKVLKMVVPNPAPTLQEALRTQIGTALETVGIQASTEFSVEIPRNPAAQTQGLIPGVKNAIAVASGKGGVGKSTVAANLATALHGFGARVGLMDADVYGPSIPILMGALESPQVTPEKRIIPPEMRGIKLISMGYFLPKDEAVIWRGPMLHKMIQDFLGIVEWGDLDYLVIDLPPGTGDIQLSLCQTIPLTGAVIVSTPQDLALEVASKAIAMFRKLNTPVLGIVENMSYYVCLHCGERDDIFGHGGAENASGKLGYPFLGGIPLNSSIRERSDQGVPVALERQSPGAEAFIKIAEEVAGQVASANYQQGPSLTIEN